MFEHRAFDSRQHYPAFTEHRMTGFQMAADKEAIGLSRVHNYYSRCNPPSQDIVYSVLEHIITTSS